MYPCFPQIPDPLAWAIEGHCYYYIVLVLELDVFFSL